MSVDTLLSEHTIVKYDALGESRSKAPAEVIAMIETLQATANTTSAIFTEVVIFRSVLFQKENGALKPLVKVWFHKGPFSSLQFLAMMQFPQGLSQEAWSTHLTNIAKIPSSLHPAPSMSRLPSRDAMSGLPSGDASSAEKKTTDTLI